MESFGLEWHEVIRCRGGGATPPFQKAEGHRSLLEMMLSDALVPRLEKNSPTKIYLFREL